MHDGKGRGSGLVLTALLLLAAPAVADEVPITGHQFSAFELGRLQERARSGDAEAEYRLARAYETGNGLPRDPALAMIHLSRAATLGLPQAQYELARYYETNDHLAGAAKEAAKWYRRAAENGHATARKKAGVPRVVARRTGAFNPPAAPGTIRLDGTTRPLTEPEETSEADIRAFLKEDPIPENQIRLVNPDNGNFAMPGAAEKQEHQPEQRFAETVPDPVGRPAEADPVQLAALPKGPPSCQELFKRIHDPIKAVDINDLEDPDVVRNRKLIKRAGLCMGVHLFKDAGRDWTVQYLFNPAKQPGPVWAVLHDNEDSAFDAAVRLVDSHGGGAVMIEAAEKRLHEGQDTNRVFAATRREAKRCKQVRSPHEQLIEAIMAAFNAARPERLFLALHSNDDGYELGGGTGTISVNRTTMSLQPFPSTVVNRELPPEVADEDSIVLMAHKARRKIDPKTRATITALNGEGLHAVMEQVDRKYNDCSLSNHVVLNNLGDYYNIEVEHGRAEVQFRMAETLLKVLGIKGKPSPVVENFIIPGGG